MRPRHEALRIVLIRDPATKAEAARALYVGLQKILAANAPCEANGSEGIIRVSEADADVLGLDEAGRQEAITLNAAQQAAMPGRPARPSLVPAKQVPSRSPFTLEGRAALLHAICHIEFNAIKKVFLVGR